MTANDPRFGRHIDTLEEGLSRLVGDVAAHQVGRALRGVAGWGEQAGRTLAANVKEYLQEETRDLVPRAELEGFAEDVTALAQAVDALEARIGRSGNPLTPSSPPAGGEKKNKA